MADRHVTRRALSDALDGALGEAEAETVRAHVAACAECAAAQQSLAAVRAAGPSLLAGDEPVPPVATVLAVLRRRRTARRARVVGASVLLLASAATGVLWVRRPAAAPSEPSSPLVLVDERADVEARVAQQLAIIDGAIHELRVLLEAQPRDTLLRARLVRAETDRRELAAMADQVLRGAYDRGGM